jgi:hypothetical protein
MIPITHGPNWDVPAGAGIGVDIDPDKLAKYHERYLERGQFQPSDPALLGTQLYR